ncbi:MAG: agarase [Pseudolabrys sp.]
MADGRFRANGRFRVADDCGVQWLVDPDGGRFLSSGVNNVSFDPDQIQDTRRAPYAEACALKYGGAQAWRAAAAQRLASWHFNTLGSWSDEAVADAGTTLAIAPNLDLGMSFAWAKNDADSRAPRQAFPDVFDPLFKTHAEQRARERCAARRNEPRILGWFMDNELRWGPDWRGPEDLLTLFLNLAPDAPGRGAAQEWCETRRRNGAPADTEANDFTALVAERYFALTSEALRAADPEHLNLGSRFAYPPRPEVVEAAARHCDVVSFNCYDPSPAQALANYERCGKPLLIGEFSFRATDSRLPNTRGASPIVATQADRTAAYRSYATTAFQHPQVVGVHWFEHADQPAEGRFDGENSNYGTVAIDDRIYTELITAMTEINAVADTLHATAGA